MKNKAVITCDIIGSRKYSSEDRKRVNLLLKEGFAECCKLVPEAKVNKLSFNIVQGDEFQFLLDRPKYSYEFIINYRLILSQSDISPIFRASVGIGEVSVVDENTYQMDGEAFHRSRNGVEMFKLKKYSNRLTYIDYKVRKNKHFDMALKYQDSIELSWSKKQKEAIYWYLNGLTFKEIAEKINISFQAVGKRVYNSNLLLFEKGIEYIGSMIK
ncbi:MAG: SatD family protein [Candidatus Marinimicrobia bacterium]|nr:SatD family protein [Candidatus Neomarinimicrobiota bacterium]